MKEIGGQPTYPVAVEVYALAYTRELGGLSVLSPHAIVFPAVDVSVWVGEGHDGDLERGENVLGLTAGPGDPDILLWFVSPRLVRWRIGRWRRRSRSRSRSRGCDNGRIAKG